MNPPPQGVREQLDRILASEPFVRSKRSAQFLRYVVEETLAGRGENLKGYAIAIDVLGRHDSFDSAVNPIVRVVAQRARERLEQYYHAQGRDDPIRIVLSKGSYVPSFESFGPTPRPAPPDANIGRSVGRYRLLERIGGNNLALLSGRTF